MEYKINYSKFNYHINKFDKNDETVFLNIITRLKQKYPNCNDYVGKCFHGKKTFNNALKEKILNDFIVAQICYLSRTKDIKNEDQLLKMIMKNIHIYFPIVIENYDYFNGTHLIQYEPKFILMMCFAIDVIKMLSNELDKNEITIETLSFDEAYALECIGLLRNLRSSLLLLSIGDDVHAIALTRGFLEILSKLILAHDFKDEFLKFKKYNNYLQLYKHFNSAIPQDMQNDLCDKINSENYIAYAWARDKNNRRITTMKELIYTAIGRDENVQKFIQMSSEFVHEDYVGIGYDFITLRIELVDYYFILLKSYLTSLENTIESKKIKKYLELFEKE